MHKFFSKIKKVFNQWSYHDNGNGRVINYTPDNHGVFGRHIDWNSLIEHIFVWLIAIVIAIMLIIIAIKALILVMFIGVIAFLAGLLWLFSKVLSVQNNLTDHTSHKKR